jgi:hypothetical protein
MDRKEKKRDIAVFVNMLKDVMNDPFKDVLQTLDRDIRYFIYGRIATLVKHNDNKPIGSIADIGAVVGVAFADVVNSIIGDAGEERDKLVDTVRHNFLNGFNSRFELIDKTEAENDRSNDTTETENAIQNESV